MNFTFKLIDQWSLKILEIFKRFPLAIFSSFMMTMLLIFLMEIDPKLNSYFILIANKVIIVLSLGIFLFPALHLLSKKIWFKLTGIGLLVLYYYYLPLNVLDSSIIMNHILFILALCFMFLWAPFMDIKISNQNIWEWTQTILQNLLVVLLLSLAIFIIFYITFYALDELFDIQLSQRHYAEFVLFLLGTFTVSYFLGKLPKYILLVQNNHYDGIGLVFTKYILTPSFFIYFMILFAYILKIVLTQTWATSNIDMLALGYVFIAIGTYMHWTPLWDDANKKFRTLIWGSTFVISLFMGFSIYIRVLNSSFEAYYLISLFTLWLALISLYFLFFKNASYKWIFFSISLLLVLSQSEQLITVSLDLYEKGLKLL